MCVYHVRTLTSLIVRPVDLPGVLKNDLDVVIANGCVTIKGERRKAFEKDDIWGTHLSERAHGRCTRTLSLPTNADCEHADASFENGVLKITFPKLGGGSLFGKKLLIA